MISTWATGSADVSPSNALPAGPGLSQGAPIPWPPLAHMLPPNTRLRARNKKAFLVLQNDRNVVLYTDLGQPIWSSKTQDDHFSDANPFFGALVMQNDGNLVLVDGLGRPIWATNSQDTFGNRLANASLEIEDNGNVFIFADVYDGSGRFLQGRAQTWSTATWDFVPHHSTDPGMQRFFDIVAAFATIVVSALAPELGPVAVGAMGSLVSAASAFVPGALRGEDVDHLFVQTLTTLAKKYAGQVGGEISDDLVRQASDTLAPVLTHVGDGLQQWGEDFGVDFDKLANLPIDARNAIAGQLDLETFARDHGVSPEMAQAMLDGVTRTANPKGRTFDADGNVRRVNVRAGFAALSTLFAPKVRVADVGEKIDNLAAYERIMAGGSSTEGGAGVVNAATPKSWGKLILSATVVIGGVAFLAKHH